MSVDTELFISEVEKRPALFNTKLKEYSDKILKKKLWIEVFEQFIENWSKLGTAEQEEKGQELQKKWKNLRTCFKREYDAQKKEPSGSGAKKRRKYIYFDQLLFLRDSLESRETSSSLGNNSQTDDVGSEMEETEDIPVSPNTPQSNTNGKRIFTKTHQKKTSQKSYEESLLQILQEKRDEDREIDEDKYFLLSLLPTFKKFNEDQKFLARTEIINIMRRIRLSGNNYQSLNQYNANPLYGSTSRQNNNTAQFFSTFVPAGQPQEGPISPLQSVMSPNTQDSWENASEASSLFHM